MTSIATMKNPGESPLIAETLVLFQKARLEEHFTAEHFVDELTSLFGPAFNTNVIKGIGYHFVPKNLVFSGTDGAINLSLAEAIKGFVKDLDEIYSFQVETVD